MNITCIIIVEKHFSISIAPVTSAVLLIGMVKRGRLGGISEMPLIPLWG
jgi:hypothetical protein